MNIKDKMKMWMTLRRVLNLETSVQPISDKVTQIMMTMDGKSFRDVKMRKKVSKQNQNRLSFV